MKLAIKGHPTRGKEVIELLEMLGGVNSDEAYGNLPNNWDVSYYIFKDGVISVSEDKILIKKQFEIFTLEEFLEKYPFKVGDKVIYEDKIREITKMVWEEQTNTIAYKLDDKLYCNVIDDLQPYKEETMEGTIKIDIPKGYEFFGINDNNQVVLAKKQPQYPKTYEECCNILNLPHCGLTIDVPLHYSPTIICLTKLLICRDAYWKISGEQMGLGKPWKPDWNDCTQHKFGLYTLENEIRCINLQVLKNIILVFPTEEMRDAFYENFNELIVNCKELL